MLPMPTVSSTRLCLGAVACPGFFYQVHTYLQGINYLIIHLGHAPVSLQTSVVVEKSLN
jgi:hypothetical protein